MHSTFKAKIAILIRSKIFYLTSGTWFFIQIRIPDQDPTPDFGIWIENFFICKTKSVFERWQIQASSLRTQEHYLCKNTHLFV